MPRSDVALLVDRVPVQRGKPQRYLTQFSLEGGKLVMDPVEDEEGLGARRAARPSGSGGTLGTLTEPSTAGEALPCPTPTTPPR